MPLSPEDVLNFWFMEINPSRWFKPDAALDETVRERFTEAYEQAAHSGFKSWEETPEGMLALLLLLSAFPRRMFRGTPRAYVTDDRALKLARTGIIKHFDDRIDRQFKLFFYLPFGYADNTGEQRLAVYFIRERTKERDWIESAIERQLALECFGRFPQRNAALGRTSTLEEIDYLKQTKEET
jgi:uncharacterized protein (DUF924 family)